MYNDELWDGNLGLEQEGRDRKVTSEIFKMGIRSGKENTGYIVREEIQRKKLRSRAGRTVWKFEEKLIREGGNKITR